MNKANAFSSYSVDDTKKAKKFYEEVLGLETREQEMGLLELHLGQGAPVILYPKERHEAAAFTVLNFAVDDLEAAVGELTAKGVKFEQYTGHISTDEKGISRSRGNGPDVAWFRDPAGNILSVMKHS